MQIQLNAQQIHDLEKINVTRNNHKLTIPELVDEAIKEYLINYESFTDMPDDIETPELFHDEP